MNQYINYLISCKFLLTPFITNRDLKAKEPFFSSGFTFGEDESMGAIKQKLKGAIDSQRDFLKNLDTDAQSIKMAHKYEKKSSFNLYNLGFNNCTLKAT